MSASGEPVSAQIHRLRRRDVSTVAAPEGPAETPAAPVPTSLQAIISPPRNIWPLILWVTLPFWALMTVTRVLSYMVRVAAVPNVSIAAPGARILQHVVLFGVLVLFYRAAFAIGWPLRNRWRALLAQLGLALAFACLATPVLTLSIDLSWGEPFKWLMSMTDPGALREQLVEWARSGILAVSIPDFFISYWFGLMLLVGVRTYRELNDQKLRVAQLQNETVRARLHALRMQLNPHFLFNTLHSVTGLIDQRPPVARQIVVRLGDLLRRTLRDGDADVVPLAREIDFVRNYLEIQQLRFPDRLRFTIEVDPAVQSAMVPSLILQPLAENAVVHGASEEEDCVTVTIRARQVIDSVRRWLELSVHNTGSGQAEGEGSGERIGVMNTRARLQAMHGDRCLVEFGVVEDGYLARLRLPLGEEIDE